MKQKAALIICALGGIAAAGLLRGESPPGDLAAYAATLRAKFPGVPTIAPSGLAAIEPSPILLDVREENEFAVSHLPGAVRAGQDPVAQLQKMGAKSDAPVVVYCSVGYRSAVLAEKLQAAGFRNVRNLEGSIFAWANEGRPLVAARGEAAGVHPFNIPWGRYLEKSLWRWKPEP